jgi:hypothetical protein
MFLQFPVIERIVWGVTLRRLHSCRSIERMKSVEVNYNAGHGFCWNLNSTFNQEIWDYIYH